MKQFYEIILIKKCKTDNEETSGLAIVLALLRKSRNKNEPQME